MEINDKTNSVITINNKHNCHEYNNKCCMVICVWHGVKYTLDLHTRHYEGRTLLLLHVKNHHRHHINGFRFNSIITDNFSNILILFAHHELTNYIQSFRKLCLRGMNWSEIVSAGHFCFDVVSMIVSGLDRNCIRLQPISDNRMKNSVVDHRQCK